MTAIETAPDAGAQPTKHDAAEGKTANIVYILYLVSLIVGITSIVGVIMAYINRGDASEWVKTHYRFQIRTFWIGLLYAVIGGLTTLIIIGWFILLALLIWLIVRCVKGIKFISQGAPVPNPASWMFG